MNIKNNIKNRVTAYFLAVVMLASVLALPIAVQASTAPGVNVTVEGLGSMFVDLPVTARVVFTLTGEGAFAPEITAGDFWVGGLPLGLQAMPAVRESDNVVSVRITGAPSVARTTPHTLRVPENIPARNFRPATPNVRVSAVGLDTGPVTASANVTPGIITFDLNPYGVMHRDNSVIVNLRGFTLRHIRYGLVNLREGVDYSPTEATGESYGFILHTSFLSRLPVGRWELTFHVTQGANPVLIMNIIDTSLPVEQPPIDPVEPPPVPPMTPLHPDENFMFLTGGAAVNMNNLRWDLNRARVNPQMQDGAATVTVRTHVLDHMSWNMPGQSFEIITPMVRTRIPLNILDGIFGGRAAITRHGLLYNQVDLRISLIDRSNDPRYNLMFNTVYPDGQLLTPLVDLRVELINAATGEVILSAVEIATPIEMTFVVMDNAGHLRPAGVLFQRAWLEFVPYRTLSPNEITTRTIFPGVIALMHNSLHFGDVEHTHWGFVQSYTAAYSGLVMPMDELHPYTLITRGEFAQLLAISLQLPRAGAGMSGFVDVPFPHVYFDGISRLFQAGLLGPYIPGTQFFPDAIITREEIAAIAGMALLLGDPVRTPVSRPLELAFWDAWQFSPWHWHNVQTTVNYSVMVGAPDNSFRPQAPATRLYSLAVAMRLSRALGLIDEVG